MTIKNHTPKVLVADDDDLFRMTVCMMIEDMECEILEASNGADALQLFNENDLDLVVTDIVMPGMEGIETIMLMRKEKQDLPIIAMSGGGQSGRMDFLEIAGKLGANAALQKPFEVDELCDLVTKHLPAHAPHAY